MSWERSYICIDLKSFYASVECVERGLDAMKTNLVVADPTRTDKTICLAVSPAMKKLGVPNRCRVFEIPKGIKYIMAPPRMQLYINYAAEIYGIYLNYFSKEDIHVYSIDEVFIDVTHYKELYEMDEIQIAMMLMDEIVGDLGILSTCGIGENMYLAKIALDITAKHSPDRIGALDEETYRKTLWTHEPLDDFWRIGRRTANKLKKYGIRNMRDIATTNPDFLYDMFGIDAEILIDHAWGREPVTMADIKNYKPKSNGLTNSQILPHDYSFEEGLLIAKEMLDVLCLELVEKGLATESVTMYVGYSNALALPGAKGTFSLGEATSSYAVLAREMERLFHEIVNPEYGIRRIGIFFNKVNHQTYRQYSWFMDSTSADRERQIQEAAIAVKKRYGKNKFLRGMDLEESAMAMERNDQIGGHRK
ncbi:MAG: DNA repair protein [Eubacterium sp.]|nr:DNA repair protein [Eubacterium sp.]